MRVHTRFLLAVLLIFLSARGLSAAQELEPLRLPPPRMAGGLPLMEALKQRQSIREFSDRQLPLQTLSDLLWAAFGVNRPSSGHRTAPSAMNSQETDIYVALRDGLYVYDAHQLVLAPVARDDVRGKTGGQPFVQVAPLALIFVADLSKMVKAKPEDRPFYAGIDAGYVSQNVYLFCASAGLATVVHEISDRASLTRAMRLRPEQKIILAQAVGFPEPGN